MSSKPTQSDRRTATSSGPRCSKADAISAREFELLYRGARAIECDVRRLEAEFVVIAGGRLGLRPGETAHFRTDWIDWRERIVEIPAREPCAKGRDGGPCGYCRAQAKEMVEHNDGLAFDEAINRFWKPKTTKGARSIPFGFSDRVQLVLEDVDDHFDGYPHSRASVNRRVDRAAEHADGLDTDSTYPHALRATAASWHAGQGVGAAALQTMFGWRDLATANSYVDVSGRAVARAVEGAHSG